MEGELLIHCTKHHKDNQLKTRNSPAENISREYKTDTW